MSPQPKLKEPPKSINKEDEEDDRKPAAKTDDQKDNKRKPPKLPLHSNSIGKSPNMDLTDTDSESNDDDRGEDLITTLKAQEIRNMKKAARERRERGSRERGLADVGDLELLKASKKQKREERKIELEKEREEKAEKAEVQRLLKATARESMPQTKRDIELCMDILPATWKKSARRNAINRVKAELNELWPISDATEVTDREVTELIKIR
jgi:hypothetical protein